MSGLRGQVARMAARVADRRHEIFGARAELLSSGYPAVRIEVGATFSGVRDNRTLREQGFVKEHDATARVRRADLGTHFPADGWRVRELGGRGRVFTVGEVVDNASDPELILGLTG